MWRSQLQQRLRALHAGLFPSGQSPLAIALAVFVGVFIGVLPTLGFALPLTAVCAALLRLPKGPALVASFVATPPTLFFFFYPLGYLLGRKLTHPAEVNIQLLDEMSKLTLFTAGEVLGRLWGQARSHVLAFGLGMTIVAFITAVLIASVCYRIVLRRKVPPPDAAR